MIELELEVTSHVRTSGEVRVVLRPPGMAYGSEPTRQPGRINAMLHLVGAEDELAGLEHGKRCKLTLTPPPPPPPPPPP